MKGNCKINWQNELMIRKLVAESTSQSNVLRKMELIPAANAVTFRKYIKIYNIDTSHFAGRSRNGTTKLSLSEILVEHSTRVDRFNLKKRLVNEKIIDYKCEKCNNKGTWQEKELSLQLEHKNGINSDYRKENLCFLCPNCHSQTSTFAGRNKGK